MTEPDAVQRPSEAVLERMIAAANLDDDPLRITIAFRDLLQQLMALPREEIARFLELVPKVGPLFRSQVFYLSLAFFTTRDAAYLGQLADMLDQLQAVPAQYHEVADYLSFSVFSLSSQLDPDIRAKIERRLRTSYRAAVASLARSLAPRPPAARRRAVKKIALLSPQMLGPLHAPSRDLFFVAGELSRLGFEVLVVNTNILSGERRVPLLDGGLEQTINRSLAGAQLIPVPFQAYAGINIPFFSLPGFTDLAHETEQVLDLLEEQQVDAVIAHETPFIQDFVAGRWPVLWVTTGAVIPSARAHALWVSADQLTDEHRALAKEAGDPLILAREYLYTLPDSATSIERSALGIADDAVVLIAIGNRLPVEIDQRFVDRSVAALRRDARAVLLLVGEGTPAQVSRFPAELTAAGRIRGLGHQNDVRALFRIGDIYVNPFRRGGGTTAQFAMHEGMAMVTLDDGHVGAVAGTGLSDTDETAWSLRLERLIADPEFRAASRAASRARIQAKFDFQRQVQEMVATLHQLHAGWPARED